MNPFVSLCPNHIGQSLMQQTTESSDTSYRSHTGSGSSLYVPVMVAGFLGSLTVLATESVRLRLNQPVDDFLHHHCFNNMTSAETSEYAGLVPRYLEWGADLAITSTALFIASGGLGGLYNVGKSIYDRTCSFFRAPDPTLGQHEKV